MFYELSKFVGFFLIPSQFLIGLGGIGIILLPTRFARLGRILMAVGVVLVMAVGFLPVGTALTLPLEQRFPRWKEVRGAPTGMIVLGGIIDPILSNARGSVELGDSAERVIAAVELARRYPDSKLIFSGGDSDARNPIEADYAIRLFESLGVPGERLIAETRSRSTAENAQFTKERIAPKPAERWLLITSAAHMPRAVGAFRKVGFAVEPYPVDYLTGGPDDLRHLSGSFTGGLTQADAAAHEWIGLVTYWWTGRSSALFPGPEDGDGAIVARVGKQQSGQ